MLWPVLLNTAPRDSIWSLGERVSTRLRWLHAPELPDDMVVHNVRARGSALIGGDGLPWAQLVEAGDLRAVREGHHSSGDVVLDGCLGVDAWLGTIGELPSTIGSVRRVQVLHQLHGRGAAEWIPCRGALRLTDVPDASPHRLRDDPSIDDDADLEKPQPEPEPGTMMFLSPEQYFRLAYDRLPAKQWQAQGFLVDLDVHHPAD
jgi:hypothetical protein